MLENITSALSNVRKREKASEEREREREGEEGEVEETKLSQPLSSFVSWFTLTTQPPVRSEGRGGGG